MNSPTNTASIVICTLNRPDDIQRCVSSLVAQTVKPKQIIVVDAGDMGGVSKIIEDACVSAAIGYIYLQDKPSTTRQRNKGADVADSDIVFFMDDDVVLAEDYIEEIMNCYEKDKTCEVGGATGVSEPKPSATRGLWRIFAKLFFLAETRENTGSRMKRSGFPSHGTGIEDECGCQIMPSTAVSYRLDVFREYYFDRDLTGYVMAEDLDLSYRVSREYRLYTVARAVFRHAKSPVARNPTREHEKRRIAFTQYFFQKNLGSSLLNRVIRYWALCGMALKYFVISFRSRNFERYRGFMDGIRVARKNGLFGRVRCSTGPLSLQ